MKRGICTRKKQTISKALNSVLRAFTLEKAVCFSLLEDITLFCCFECTEVNKLNDFLLYLSVRFYEKRFFRIRNGVLFWYMSERAQDVSNKIELNKVEEIKEKP